MSERSTNTWLSIGSIRCVAVDEEGRRHLSAYHTEPAAWMLLTHLANGRIAYVSVTIQPDEPRQLTTQRFENGFNSLGALVEGMP